MNDRDDTADIDQNAFDARDGAELAGRIALRLAEADDDQVDAIVLDALAILAVRAGADRTYITLYHDDGTFENSHEWTAEGVVPQLPAIQEMRNVDFPYTTELARRGEVFATSDVAALPDEAAAERRSFSSFGIQGVLQVPIVVNGRGIALVGFNHFRTGVSWPDDLIAFVRQVGQAFVIAVIRRRSARSLRHADERIERARRVQDDLLAHFSHELRTPLHAMLGYAELLELDEHSERRRNSLMEIQFHGRHLLSMVDDLISLAAEPGGRRVEFVEIGPIVVATLDALAPVAELRRVRCDVRPEVRRAVVRTEVGRLRQVVHCVLSAAVQSLPATSSVAVAMGTDPADPARGPAIHVELASPRPIRADDVVMPLAAALIEGHGSIRYEPADDETRLRAVIAFNPTVEEHPVEL